jgi:hypothetical protein
VRGQFIPRSPLILISTHGHQAKETTEPSFRATRGHRHAPVLSHSLTDEIELHIHKLEEHLETSLTLLLYVWVPPAEICTRAQRPFAESICHLKTSTTAYRGAAGEKINGSINTRLTRAKHMLEKGCHQAVLRPLCVDHVPVFQRSAYV